VGGLLEKHFIPVHIRAIEEIKILRAENEALKNKVSNDSGTSRRKRKNFFAKPATDTKKLILGETIVKEIMLCLFNVISDSFSIFQSVFFMSPTPLRNVIVYVSCP
jgi:hypothetical protein